jgi:hypothetical protein
VPRFWLVGFDEAKQPLTPQQVREGHRRLAGWAGTVGWHWVADGPFCHSVACSNSRRQRACGLKPLSDCGTVQAHHPAV